jgi:tetratricopeptide (TPR) repeat protein
MPRRWIWISLAALLCAALAYGGRGWGASFCAGRGSAAIGRLDWPAAKDWLDRAWRIDPDRGATAFLQARLARKRARLDELAKWLDRAREKGFSPPLIETELLLAAAQTGDLRRIESELAKRLAELPEQQPEICEAWVNGCLRNYRLREAQRILGLWVKDWPADPMPHVLWGRVYEHLSDLPHAEQEFETALKIRPGHPPAAYNLGRVKIAQQQPEAALESYRVCSKNLFEPQPALVGMAQCLRLLSRLDEARRVLDSAVAANQEFVDDAYRLVGDPAEGGRAYYAAERGQIELEAGNYAEAAPWLEKAVAASPTDWKLRYSLGFALQRIGRGEDAERELHRVEKTKAAMSKVDRAFDALHEDPQNVEARFEIGRLFLELLSEDQGLVWLNSVLMLDADHLPTHRLLAEYFESHAGNDPAFARLAREHRKKVRELENSPGEQ